MSERLTDYYVGLLRGYILAHNAPQQIQHALEELLTYYRSQAGALIGNERFDRAEINIPEISTPVSRVLAKEVADTKPKEEGFIWSKRQMDALRDHYGVLPMDQLEALIGRPRSSIYNKASVLGLTKKAHQLKGAHESTVLPEGEVADA